MLIEIHMILFSLLIAIISALPDCPRNKPIYKEGRCGSGNCYKAEYEQGICVVVNKIAKTQWVTSIIHIGTPNTFVYFQKYQNGDLILELLTDPGSYTRMIYDLKQNEEALLVKDGEFTPSEILNSDYSSSLYGNLYIIKIGEDEYPIFIGIYNFGVELIDLKEKNVYNYRNPNFLDGITFSTRGCNIFLTNFALNNENLYLLAYNNGLKTSIKILKFTSKNLGSDTTIIKEIKYLNPFVDDLNCITPISCFISDSNLIMCLYTWDMSVSPYNIPINYIIISVYNENLEIQNEIQIYEQEEDIRDIHKFKAIHLKGDTGVFLTFSKFIYVITYIKDYYNFENYFPEFAVEDRIELSIFDENGFQPKYYTDLQKISDSKLCYISFPNQNSTTFKGYYIAVALLNFIGTQSMTIRYYYIKMNLFFGYALDSNFKFNIYNNYIALCFSARTYEYGDQTAFMLLSYANNTYQNFDIIDILLYDNEIKISNISYDLKEHLKIENNIFGYKIEKSEVLEKKNCEKFDMKFIKNDIFIQANSQLILDDTIFKIIFEENENDIYYKGNCTIKLNLYITDPDFEEYENYPDSIIKTYGEFD